MSRKRVDAFISHATEDKEDFVRPLAHALQSHGVELWYDDFTLEVGENLSASIDKGIASCRFGIVIFSPAYLLNKWTKYELSGLTKRYIEEGREIILPVRHKVSVEEIRRFAPGLSNVVALNSAEGLEAIAKKLAYKIKPSAMRRKAVAPTEGNVLVRPSGPYRILSPAEGDVVARRVVVDGFLADRKPPGKLWLVVQTEIGHVYPQRALLQGGTSFRGAVTIGMIDSESCRGAYYQIKLILVSEVLDVEFAAYILGASPMTHWVDGSPQLAYDLLDQVTVVRG